MSDTRSRDLGSVVDLASTYRTRKGEGVTSNADPLLQKSIESVKASAAARKEASDRRVEIVAKFMAGFTWRGNSWDSYSQQQKATARRIATEALYRMYGMKPPKEETDGTQQHLPHQG